MNIDPPATHIKHQSINNTV